MADAQIGAPSASAIAANPLDEKTEEPDKPLLAPKIPPALTPKPR